MVAILSDEQRADIDAIIGDADEFMQRFREVLLDPAFNGVFAMLIVARMLELHPNSFRLSRDERLT